MGWTDTFGDVASGLAGGTTGYLANQLYKGQNRSGVGTPIYPTLSEQIAANKPRTLATNAPTASTLTDKIYGGSPGDYNEVFKKAYTNLGQSPETNFGVVVSGTKELSEAYIERYQKRTGQLPSEDQVKEFVSANLTPHYAQQYITGELPNRSATYSKYVDPYLSENGIDDIASKPTDQNMPGGPNSIEGGIMGLSGRVKDLYDQTFNTGVDRFNRLYAAPRQQAVEEEAVLGRLRSPVSADPNSPIGQVDTRKANSISDLAGTLSSSQASGGVDLAKTIQNLMAGERRAGEDVSKFRSDLGLRRRALDESVYNSDTQNALTNKGLTMAEQIGKLKAGADEPNWLNYLNTAANVGGTFAKLAAL